MIKLSKKPKEPTYFKYLCIDPGCRADGGTGIALMNSKTSILPVLISPEATKKDLWELKIEEVMVKYFSLLREWKDCGAVHTDKTKILIERPKYFNTWKGAKAANSESLFKLIVCYARIWQISKMYVDNVQNVEIVHWKGQLSKEQVANRVEKETGKKFEGDCTDAVGIGLYALRKGL